MVWLPCRRIGSSPAYVNEEDVERFMPEIPKAKSPSAVGSLGSLVVLFGGWGERILFRDILSSLYCVDCCCGEGG